MQTPKKPVSDFILNSFNQPFAIIILSYISIYRMGGCIQKCCLTEAGALCCNLISILGMIYFVFTWAIFERQFDFFEFHIPDRSETRLSCIVAALIYLLFFIWTLYNLHKINREKAEAAIERSKKSLDQYNNLPSVYEEPQKQISMNSERAMARQD